MARTPTLLARVRADESGVTLIEVLVSALITALVAVGVLTGLDAASATSGSSKSRAVAANLAQADQERLRAFRLKELSNLRETRTQTVRGVPFKVVSRAEWVTDSSGTKSCTSGSTRADYIRITSTVTWTDMHGLKPVSVSSLVAPPSGSFGDEGGLAVEILDRSGTGVADVDVEVNGAQNVGGTTDAAGCVFFGYLPGGNYDVSFSKAGFVDAQGLTSVTKEVGVVNEATARVSFQYDRAGGVDVSFDTKKTGQVVPADGEWLSVENSGLASPGTRVFGTGALQAALSADGLFPFTSPYSVYSGNCTGANPLAYGQTPALVTVAPGGRQQVTVREPAVKVTGGDGLPAGTRVTLTAKALGCGGVSAFTTDGDGWLVPNPPAGPINDPGVPYGIYDVCAENGGRKFQQLLQRVDNPNGVTVSLPSTGPLGSCP
jgi:Tfp pilus assembly protein PilV